MPAAFCIRPDLAEKLKLAAKAGEISIEKMYAMSSEERRGLLGKYVDQETALGVNTGFEKAMASEQRNAIAHWVKSTFSSSEKKQASYNDVLTKINDLEKQGLLAPDGEKAFLSDLVADKLGVSVTAKEAEALSAHAAKLESLSKDTTPYNTPSLEYFKAKREMQDYIQSLTPTANLRVLTSTVGRASLLARPASVLLNIHSNTIQGFLAVAERRITTRRVLGLNGDFAVQFAKFSTDVYKKTGYDISRFQAFGEGQMARGEEFGHSQGTGAIRKVGRFYEDVVFNKTQGLPDAAFSSLHFADSANLATSILAKKEGLTGAAAKERALTVMKDVFNPSPTTKEGQLIRAQAEADAMFATYTNKTFMSHVALKVRELVNTASGDLRLGDILDPFVKTPANVLQAGLDYSGVTVTTKMAGGIVKALSDVVHGRSFDSANFAEVNRYFVRAGLGLTFAYAISNIIKPEDFIGQYPVGNPTKQQLLELQNGTTNAVHIGNKWISLDYLGPLGAPLLGFLYAKTYGGTNPADDLYRYSQGVQSTLQNFPGAETIVSAYDYIKQNPDKAKTVDSAAFSAGKAALGEVTTRIIPGFTFVMAQMMDRYKRETDASSITGKIQSQLPVVREGLPISRTIFGDARKTEPWLSTLLFGSRVSTNQDSAVINELVKLNRAGALPAITDVARSSKTAGELRHQIGETKFNEAMQSFGKNLKQGFADSMNSDEYKAADPIDRKNMLNKVKDKTLKETLSEYGYQKPEKN